jgi:hypothetical protein
VGVSFEPTTWDGGDIFMPSTTDVGVVICTERFREVFVRLKEPGVLFRALDQIDYPKSWVRTAPTGGRDHEK